MKITSPLSPITRIRRGLGQEVISNILDLFPTAVLLVDNQNKRILMANTKAMELIACTRGELVNKKLDDLFTDYRSERAGDNGSAGEEAASQQLTLIKRSKSSIEVLATFENISHENNWTMITLEPIEALQQQEADQKRRSHLLEKILLLTTAEQRPDLETALEMILSIGQEITSASSLAVYQADGHNPDLQRSAYLGNPLPEHLPSRDLIYLRSPQVWIPSKRPTAGIHTVARTGGFSYLASASIGEPNAIIGLFVIGDTQLPPNDQTLPILQILASTIHNTIQRFAQMANMSEEREQHAHYQRIVDVTQAAVQDSVVVLTSDFKVISLNRAAEQSLGYQSSDAANLHVQDILIGTENLMPALRLALNGVPTLNQDNIRLFRRSGQGFLARVSTLPVKVEEQTQGIVVLIQDLSEKEQTRSQLERLQQNALLGDVTSIFAHEVRNPINNISAGLQLMAYNLPPADPQHELIARIQADCDRLESMMKSVLSFARSAEYEMEPVDLGVLVKRLLERLTPRIASANVQTHLQIDPNTPLIMGNPRALEQVFTNLFNNAVQAMESCGGVLAVKVRPAETTGKRQYVLVVVADNGPGIPKEYLDRIFKPFFTTKTNGTGLGLAITQRIVTAHKGTIQTNSFPGGTIFNVQIPAIQPPTDEL